MAYENLKSAIKQAIKQNGNQEITGNLLQSTLLNIVNVIGAEDKLNELSSISDKAIHTFLFCDSFQELVNASNCTVKNENKILGYNGNEIEISGFKTWVIKNDLGTNKNMYVKCYFGNPELIENGFRNIALYDTNDNFVVGYIVGGVRVVRIPSGYTLKVSFQTDSIPQKGTNLKIPSFEDKKIIDCVGDIVCLHGNFHIGSDADTQLIVVADHTLLRQYAMKSMEAQIADIDIAAC